MESLKKEDLVRILCEPKNALVKQYTKLLALDNVELEISEDAMEAVAQKALDRQIGARGLRAVMEKVMTEIMFRIPSDLTIRKVIITGATINGGMPEIVRDEANLRNPLGT